MNICSMCTTNEERDYKCTSQEAKIIVYDESKQGESFGLLLLFFFALNIDLLQT